MKSMWMNFVIQDKAVSELQFKYKAMTVINSRALWIDSSSCSLTFFTDCIQYSRDSTFETKLLFYVVLDWMAFFFNWQKNDVLMLTQHGIVSTELQREMPVKRCDLKFDPMKLRQNLCFSICDSTWNFIRMNHGMKHILNTIRTTTTAINTMVETKPTLLVAEKVMI